VSATLISVQPDSDNFCKKWVSLYLLPLLLKSMMNAFKNIHAPVQCFSHSSNWQVNNSEKSTFCCIHLMLSTTLLNQVVEASAFLCNVLGSVAFKLLIIRLISYAIILLRWRQNKTCLFKCIISNTFLQNCTLAYDCEKVGFAEARSIAFK